MLIISRKKDERIIIADGIEVLILEVGRNRVRFGIKAPKDVAIQTRIKTAAEVSEEVAGSVSIENEAELVPSPDLPERF